MTTPPTKELKLFYCYAKEDEVFRHQLEQHLSNLKRKYHLITWVDREIMPGENWEEIREALLNTADLILLLVSSNFLASEYTYNKEMRRALERHANGEAKVIPILLRPVYWEETLFDNIQILPTNARPITDWENQDEALYNTIIGIEQAIQDLLIARQTNKSLKSLQLFYCYAHEDRDLRDYLDIHLKSLKRQFKLTSWYDQEIIGGDEWEKEIETHLSTANIILLLISPFFMNSEYCYTKEMTKALERHKLKKARVIPILLKDVDYEDTPFCNLQMIPTNGIPITLWPDRDAAFAEVARSIRRAVKEMLTL